MRRLPFAFYNLGPPQDPRRDPVQVALELNALANNSARPHAGVRRSSESAKPSGTICRTSSGSSKCVTAQTDRANIALYVRDNLDIDITWVELTRTSPQTQAAGDHEPRTNLIATIDDWTVMVGHAPPKVPGAAEALS